MQKNGKSAPILVKEEKMKKILVFLVLVLALVLAACGSTTTTTAPANPTNVPAIEPTAESAVSSNFPAGKFIKEGTTNYGLLFNADGAFSVFEGDNTFVRATYTVEGNVLTETSNDGGCETNESFTYTFDGTSLTFNYVGNPDDDTACAGRHADFNNVTYTLSEEANFPAGKFIKSGTTNYGLLFNADGTFSVFDGSRIFINGTYSVDGDVFTEESNSGGCVSPMKFNYTFDGTNLTFSYAGNPENDNACGGRKTDFNNVNYILTK